MTNIVDEGVGLLQAAGHKMQDGVTAVQKQARKQTKKRKKSAGTKRTIEVVASVVGAVAAFFVSKRVRSQLGRRGQ